MKLATLLVIVLSHQGFWFGGQSTTITLHPAVVGGLPGADLFWELTFDGVRLDGGKVAVKGNNQDTILRLTVPTPRVRVTLHWLYRIERRDGAKVLETGDLPLQVFPDNLMGGVGKLVGAKRLVVWDDAKGLPNLFDRAMVPYQFIESGGKLQFLKADLVLVGEGALSDSPFAQGSLLNLAQSGASVLIFRQTEPQRLIGYPLALRATPAMFEWRMGHPLLGGFEPLDLQNWALDASQLHVLQLPIDEPALEIVSYPREVAGIDRAPIDALLLTKSVGKGRVVLCQLPLGNWSSDPRSQLFLCNAIDYLLTRPQPTPRPSERPNPRFAEAKPVLTGEIYPRKKP